MNTIMTGEEFRPLTASEIDFVAGACLEKCCPPPCYHPVCEKEEKPCYEPKKECDSYKKVSYECGPKYCA
ncbi:MAG: hypothetical protein ACLPPF_21080 [Rhodomicrobium sp.]